MAPRLSEFLADLETADLLSDSQQARIRSRCEGLPESATKAVLRGLLDQNFLTWFQARYIYEGQPRKLHLGEYRVMDRLGRGATGTVYKGFHRQERKPVALKLLHPYLSQDPILVQRFQREVEATRKLDHPQLIKAFNLLEIGPALVVVMEFLEGEDLESRVRQSGPLKVHEAVDVTCQAARGLHYLHQQRIVHRDLKPANLFQTTTGQVKVMDLGLARVIEEAMPGSVEQRLTQAGTVMGTVDYMSPEQGVDASRCTAASDIYSLGCTLHFLLLGRPVFEEDTLLGRLLSHRQDPVPDLQRQRAGVPPELAELFEQMLEKEPQDRPATLAEVITRLEQLS